MAILTGPEFSDRLKGMGLGSQDRRKVIETFHDSGEKEAMEHANDIIARSNAALAGAKQAARDLCGIDIGN